MPFGRYSRGAVVLLVCGLAVTTVVLAASVSTTQPVGVPAGSRGTPKPTFVRPTPHTPGPAQTPAKPATPGGRVPEGGTVVPEERFGDEKEVLIIQALEQPTSLNIQAVPIVDAVRLLAEKTGVPIEFDRFTLAALPYGSKTLVSVKIQRQPLRDSLLALLRPLACKYVQVGDKLQIQPRPALFRICRRATWEEVALIDKLYNTPWSKALADSLQFQFQDISSEDAEANRKKLYALADSVGAGQAARVLEYAAQQYDWEWHPEGANTISFCTRTRQIELQLNRQVTAQYNEADLKEVLLDLAGRAGVLLKMEPGVLAALPTHQSERFHLTLENVTIRQAFELIGGQTGLGYDIEPDGVRIKSLAGAASAPAPSGSSWSSSTNPIVGEVSIPGENGTRYSLFIREQDLPPGLSGARLAEIKKAATSRMTSALSQPAN